MIVALDGLLLGHRHSGVERAIAELVAALPTAAPQHEYLLACTREYQGALPPGMVGWRAPGWVGGALSRVLYENLFLGRVLRGRCDVLHAPGYLLPAGWQGPSVLTVYDLIALQFPAYCTRRNALRYGRELPRSLRRATRIVVPSQTVGDELARRFPECAARTRVVPLGLSADLAPASAAEVAEVRQRYGLPEAFLLYVGNFEPKKNLADTVRAFDLLAAELPHDLVLVGGKAWGDADIQQALATARHRDRIHLPGFVPDADLPALYTAASVLVQWSRYEGAGLPPLEAMACGTPAVVSDGGALPEISGPGALVVPLGPPAQLAAALRDLLSATAACQALGEKGRRHAAQFTWERHAREVAALYEEIGDA